jgi:hypothetical protein
VNTNSKGWNVYVEQRKWLRSRPGNFPQAVKNSDPDSIASGKYDGLGAFLNAHTRISPSTRTKTRRRFASLYSNLQVSRTAHLSLGRDGTYLHKKFPTMVADVPLPSRKARCYRTFTKREFRSCSSAVVKPPRPFRHATQEDGSHGLLRPRVGSSSTTPPWRSSRSPSRAGLSLKRAIASSADVARITALLGTDALNGSARPLKHLSKKAKPIMKTFLDATHFHFIQAPLPGTWGRH